MGEEDIRRQQPNVFSMKLLGAEVRPGHQRLADAPRRDQRSDARLDESSVETTHYILGSVVGPHPFPRIVRDFQSVIGRETIEQSREQLGRLPDTGRRLRRRRQQCGRHVLSVRRSTRRSSWSASKPAAAAAKPGDHAAPLVVRPARRAARQLQLRDAGRGRPDLRRPLDLGRARLSRASAPSTATGKTPAA